MTQKEAVQRRIWQAYTSKKFRPVIELDLSGLELKELPPEIAQCNRFQTKLTKLNLSNNKITSIPEAIGQLLNLTSFDLSDNQITSIPESLVQLSNLIQLDLSSNKITSISEGFEQLVESLV